MPESAEQLSQKTEVREALEQTSGRKSRAPAKSEAFWFATHLILLVSCGVLYYLAGSRFFPLTSSQVDLAHRILRGIAMITVILAISSAISIYSIARVCDASTRFTLK